MYYEDNTVFREFRQTHFYSTIWSPNIYFPTPFTLKYEKYNSMARLRQFYRYQLFYNDSKIIDPVNTCMLLPVVYIYIFPRNYNCIGGAVMRSVITKLDNCSSYIAFTKFGSLQARNLVLFMLVIWFSSGS